MTTLNIKLLALLSLLLVFIFGNDVVLSQSSSSSVIKTLPGFAGTLPFTLETGYIGVGESEQVQLFYYLIQSEANPETDPLVLWLTGGPGCSGLSTLAYEIGPLSFDYANSSGSSLPTLILNPYSLTKEANIIFLDQPVGTGFSYATTPQAYNTSDTLAASHTYQFLRKWLINHHPRFLDNPLYIGGESYAGTYVPQVVDKIYHGNDVGDEPLLNIKGYVLGNPSTDKYNDYNGRIPYAHRMGLLSDNLYESAKRNCNQDFTSSDSDNVLCQNDLQSIKECLDKISVWHILEPWCAETWNGKRLLLSPEELPGEVVLQSAPKQQYWRRHTYTCQQEDNYKYSRTWANNKSVREALHIRAGTIAEWKRCNSSMTYSFGQYQTKSYTFDVPSSIDYHRSLIRRNCQALIYSGDHDLVVPHTATEKWIASLELQVQSDWRPWFVEGQIAGYTMKYVHGDMYGLTYATVKGAGHTAAEYKPVECLAMLKRWFSHGSV